LPVIHVVHREPEYFPPRAELEARVASPHRGPVTGSFERSPSAAQDRNTHHDEQPATTDSSERDNPFEDPIDFGDALMFSLQETSQGPHMDIHMAPPPVEEFPVIPARVGGSRGIHHLDSAVAMGAHGYNAPIQSTFHSFADAFEASPEMEDLRRDIADMRLQRTALCSDAEYPEYIRDTLDYLSDLPPARRNYYPLWNHVLEYWFPPTEGFDIVQDWDPKMSFSARRFVRQPQNNVETDELLARPKTSFAVFDIMFPQPFLCVNIHSALPGNEFTKTQARVTLEETFETLRACSLGTDLRPLSVVSAVGAKWGMVVREPNWSQSGLGLGIGSDCIGEWEEDVTSVESFRVMGYCFEEMKKGF